MNNKIYEKYMRTCFKLALKADGKTSPNPLVGCVILDKNGKKISTGYHRKAGEKHAEADALSKISDKASQSGTLIVNLEPCSHFGKTPPCADLIIKRGIKKVVIGMQDPNPLVSGNGIKKLEAAGVEVIRDILHEEAEKLNEVFIKNITQNRCFVAIKTASTLDGKIATENGNSKWITSEKSREAVQSIRNRYDAILTTSSTVIADNPSLTCRIKNGKNPIRIVLDRDLKTDFKSKIYINDGTELIIAVSEKISPEKLKSVPSYIQTIKCKENNNKLILSELFEKLYAKGIRSILVEAGGKLCGDIIKEDLADKVYHFIAPKILGDDSGKSLYSGLDTKKISNCKNFKFEHITDYSPDILIVYTRLV